MPKRDVDKRKTAKALRKLRQAAERATEEGGPGLTNWEKDFVEGVTGRLEKYGSAFRDPHKGRLEDALSQRQTHVARVLDKKSRRTKAKPAEDKGSEVKTPLRRSTLKRKTPMRPSRPARVRDVNEDPAAPPADPVLTPEEKRAALRLVPGGKSPAGKGR